MAWDWQTFPIAGARAGRRRLSPGWVCGPQHAGSALPERPARVRGRAAQLGLAAGLGFVVGDAGHFSQQRFAVRESVGGQQLPNLLHRFLISRFLLFQGPD